MNLLRWVSARSIKENFNPASHFGYPFLGRTDDVAQEENLESMAS
jgi:1-pyrroline-5-carboxylate dehydrogenase